MGSQRFPSLEFDDRMGRLRAAAGARPRWSSYTVQRTSVTSPDTRHPAITYQCLVVPAVGEAVLMMRETETVNARIYSYLEDIHGYSDTVDPVDVTLEVLRNRGFDLRPSALRNGPGSSARLPP